MLEQDKWHVPEREEHHTGLRGREVAGGPEKEQGEGSTDYLMGDGGGREVLAHRVISLPRRSGTFPVFQSSDVQQFFTLFGMFFPSEKASRALSKGNTGFSLMLETLPHEQQGLTGAPARRFCKLAAAGAPSGEKRR